MAITKIWPINCNLSQVLRYTKNKNKTYGPINNGLYEVISYTTQGYKTNQKEYITGINCSPDTALKQMLNTKLSYDKNDGRLAYHAVQSFKPGEVTPDQCHELGVKLANLMWGDRFEVVISTHLDREHLHNHFVINSVSFIDGKKFDNTRKDYIRFRNLSDDLCNGLNLSIIEDKYKGISYSEWQAANNGKPYFRQIIKHDVDVILSYARNIEQFVKGLEDLGYEVSTEGKYISLKHPQGKRFRRLYKLLRDGRYDEDHIYEKLYNNMFSPMIKVQDKSYSTFYDNDHKKLKGIRAMYFKYMYLLGIIHTRDKSPRYPSKELIKDLKYMDKITQENTFLGKHNLDNLEDVLNFKDNLINKKEYCIKERKKVYNKLKRVKDETLKLQLDQDRQMYTSQINELNKEIKLCEDIEKRVPDIEEKIKQVQEIERNKEIREKEYERSLKL